MQPAKIVAVSKPLAWLSLFASALLIAIGTVGWYALRSLLLQGAAERGGVRIDEHTADLLGRSFIAACLLTVAGLLGVANSIGQIRSGRRNLILNVTIVFVIAAAVGTLVVGGAVNR